MLRIDLEVCLKDPKIRDAITKALRRKYGMAARTRKRGKSTVVYWTEPDGTRRQKSFGPSQIGEVLAGRDRDRLDGELLTGTYEENKAKPWDEFRAEYERLIVSTKSPKTQTEIRSALDVFERIAAPDTIRDVTTKLLDKFAAERAAEPSRRRKGKRVSPATVNKEVRHLLAAFKKAAKWDDLKKVPEIERLQEDETCPEPISQADFRKLYAAAKTFHLPRLQGIDTGDWWQGMLATAWGTGWREGEILGLDKADANLETGHVLIRAATSKGKRDEWVPVQSWVVEHWRRLKHFHPKLFHYPYHVRTFYAHWCKLLKFAKVRHYKFHQLRSSFVSIAAADEPHTNIQKLARHKSFATTQKHYLNVSAELQASVERLRIPV